MGFSVLMAPVLAPDGETIYLTGRDLTEIEAFDYAKDHPLEHSSTLFAGCLR